MPNLTDNELLDRYLSGAITAPEEAELERRAGTDPVLAEALAGLQAFPEEDHGARIAAMLAGAHSTSSVEPRPQVRGEVGGARVRPLRRYAAAAAAVLLIAAALFLLPTLNDTPDTTAMRTEAPAPAAAERTPEPEPTPRQETPAAAKDDAPPAPAPSSPTPDPRPRPQTKSTPPPPPPPPPAPELTADEDIADEEAAETVSLDPAAERETTTRQKAEEQARRLEAEERAQREAASRKIKELPTRELDGIAATTAGATSAQEDQSTAPAAGQRRRGAFITGSITDENGEPIPNVLVRLPGQPIGERTDTAGVFRLAADATASRLEFSHPDFESETLDVDPKGDDIQLTLEARDDREEQYEQAWKPQVIPLGSGRPGYALPEEGYNALRRRIEDNRPADLPAGKYKLSFLVNPDGTLEDFVFRGTPPQEVMDYIGETIVRTSIWNVVTGDEPVRVYYKVVFE